MLLCKQVNLLRRIIMNHDLLNWGMLFLIFTIWFFVLPNCYERAKKKNYRKKSLLGFRWGLAGESQENWIKAQELASGFAIRAGVIQFVIVSMMILTGLFSQSLELLIDIGLMVILLVLQVAYVEWKLRKRA